MVDVANFAARNFGFGPDLAQIDLARNRNALAQQELQMGPLRQQYMQQQIDTGAAHEQALTQQNAAQDQAQKIQWLHGASQYALQHPEAWGYVVDEGKKRGIIPPDFNAPHDPQKLQDFVNQVEVMQGGGPPPKQTVVPAGGALMQEGSAAPLYVNPKDEPQPTVHAVIDPKTGKGVYVSARDAINKEPYSPSILASTAPLIPADDPTVSSFKEQILGGNATLANVPMNYRSSVANALSQTSKNQFSPMAASRFTLAASRITSPYTNMSAYKLTADGKPYLERIDAAMKNPGSVSDQDLLDSLTKLNTGGNAVTDAQVRLITDGKSYSDMASTFANKFKSGGVLSPDQRGQILAIANQIYSNYKAGYQPIYDKAAAQLQAAGIPRQFWTIPDLNAINGPTELGGAPSTQTGTPAQGGWKIEQVGP